MPVPFLWHSFIEIKRSSSVSLLSVSCRTEVRKDKFQERAKLAYLHLCSYKLSCLMIPSFHCSETSRRYQMVGNQRDKEEIIANTAALVEHDRMAKNRFSTCRRLAARYSLPALWLFGLLFPLLLLKEFAAAKGCLARAFCSHFLLRRQSVVRLLFRRARSDTSPFPFLLIRPLQLRSTS